MVFTYGPISILLFVLLLLLLLLFYVSSSISSSFSVSHHSFFSYSLRFLLLFAFLPVHLFPAGAAYFREYLVYSVGM
jgi:hypothetical protein